MFGAPKKTDAEAQGAAATTNPEAQAEGFSDPKPTTVEEAPAEGNEQAGSDPSNEDTAGSDEAGNDATASAEAPTDSSSAEEAASDISEPSPETDSTQIPYGDQGVTVGRIVNYVPKSGTKVQPAQVVAVWPNNGVNLLVSRDGTNDTEHDDAGSDLVVWKTSVPYAEPEPAGFKPNTWHWPKKA